MTRTKTRSSALKIEVDVHLPVDIYCSYNPYDGRRMKDDDGNHDVHGDEDNDIEVFLRE